MVAEGFLETLYALFSAVVSLTGLMLVALATQAYAREKRAELFYLAIGFTFVVAAVIATTVTAFLADFRGVRVILTVNYGLTTVGYLLVVYGVWDR
ncbi:MAG: hypothetical protein ABEI31_05990 [Halodesulfurarchaeum sp.]